MENILHRSLMGVANMNSDYFTLHVLDDGIMTLHAPTKFETIIPSLVVNEKNFIEPFTSSYEIFIDSNGSNNDYLPKSDVFCEYSIEEDPDGIKNLCIYKDDGEGVDYNDVFFYYGTEQVDNITYDKWRKAERYSSGLYWSTGNNNEPKGEYYILTERITVESLLSYSINKGNWIPFFESVELTLEKDDEVRIKCITNGYFDENNKEYGILLSMFECNCDYEVKGNIMSLLYGDDFDGKIEFKPSYSQNYGPLSYLFRKQTNLKKCDGLILPATTLERYCYYRMFEGCTSVTTTPELPATTLATGCYYYMFYDCTGLTSAPELPATTLAYQCYNSMFYGTNVLPDCSNIDFTNESVVASSGLIGLFAGTKVRDADLERILPKNSKGKYCLPVTTLLHGHCYQYMFQGCTSLTTAPELPATTLCGYCYNSMFSGCTSLVEAPELPATTLANYCYDGMFSGCTSLTTAPELPATTLCGYCYNSMFSGCTSLVEAPELPATTVADLCYRYMFKGCTSLIAAPELPATTLADWCYSRMFQGCTSLTSAPELPATTLAEYCYGYMFSGCTSLTAAPELPATTLAVDCYEYMFDGCTSLTAAPELPATTLEDNCYKNMFYNCSNLSYIKMLATDISATNCLYNWVSGVASSGTFFKHSYMTTLPSGESGIPYGWTVEDYSNSYFTMEALSNGFMAKLSNACEYRIDDGSWNTLSAGVYTPKVNKGQTLSFRGNLTPDSSSGIGTFTVNETRFNIKGNIMSLLYGDNFKRQTDLSGKDYAFYKLFHNCPKLQNAENLILPATTLANRCYEYMFYQCTGLKTAPFLPATTLTYHCYYGMFQGCANLTTPPELPATTLAADCYSSMFSFCTSLTSAPVLPVTTLEDRCYYGMFRFCTGLTTAPELPATTLTLGCYGYMFEGCTSLTSAPELPATTLASYCYYWMFKGCTGLKTAPELPATTLAGECYRNMFEGCTGLKTAPVLPATTLASYCYYEMFYGCSNLNYIKMLATDISATNCLYNWVNGVASSGIFDKHSNMTSLPSGENGIPNGWSVRDIRL